MRGLLSTEYTQAAIGQGLHLVFAGDYHKLAEEAGVILDHLTEGLGISDAAGENKIIDLALDEDGQAGQPTGNAQGAS